MKCCPGAYSRYASGLLLLAVVATVRAAALPVFVSIPPQVYLLEQIGGDRLQVQALLGPGANPHNYDPSPRQLVALAKARAYFTIGIPFEAMWRDRLQHVSSSLEFIHCGTEGGDQHHEAHAHDQDSHLDPHVWTSPVVAQQIAICLHAALVRLDPAGASDYDRNLQSLLRQLQVLDADIRRQLAERRNRYLLVQHPGWDHFVEHYGYEQIAIEHQGHEPNARHLVQVIERARALGLDTVFVQRQYRPAAARLVAEAIGARIVEADPMAADYPENLRRLAQALAGGGS